METTVQMSSNRTEPDTFAVALLANIFDAFDQLFIIGLASVIEEGTREPVRLHWADRQTAVLESAVADAAELSELVHHHAARHVDAPWLTTVADIAGGRRSPLSPRLGKLEDAKAFNALEEARHPLIDGLEQHDWLTLRLLGALGRPSDWARDREQRIVPDRGASAWEMKTRNRGEEFIQNRLSLLARSVADRDIDAMVAGITGATVQDEVGKNALNSRTPTGLRAPGPADNARAWCALWGISAFPTRPVSEQHDPTRQVSVSAGAVRDRGRVWFAVPSPEEPKTLAALRAVIRSAALGRQAAAAARVDNSWGAGTVSRDGAWLFGHRVPSFVLFERAKSDNANAPELFMLPGRIVPVVQILPLRTVPSASSPRRKSRKGRENQSVY